MRKCLAIFHALLILVFNQNAYGWGFLGHRTINYYAVFSLPPGLFGFYKNNISYIEQHAVDADSRRYLLENEGPRHYMDCDHYEKKAPLDTVPHNWYAAVEKYGEDSLNAHGILPWHVMLELSRLTKAMEAKNTKDILKISADIGHYIADAHVPLHSCSNYNGQKTGQEGIHALWETRIPQLFLDSFDTYSGTVEYLEKPADHIWNIISESFQGVDSVLHYQRVAESLHASDMYSYEVIANKNQRVFSEAFCADYHRLMNAMVERRMRSAIYSVAAFWYTAWVNAGQPELSGTADPGETPPDESLLKKGEIKGRKEE